MMGEVYVLFVFPWQFAERATLEALIERLGGLLRERDKRFVPNDHLAIRFSTLPDEVRAVWTGGQLTIIGGETVQAP